MYSTWDELGKRYREQSRWWSPTPETSSNNPPELEEIEVVRPEVLARWRRIGVPEPTIQALIKQHQRATEARRLEEKIRIPELDYPVPELPKVEEKAEVVAMALDTDGWLEERMAREDKIRRIDRWRYRWEYTVPAIGFVSETYELTEKLADMLNVSIGVHRVRPRARLVYRVWAVSSRAMRTIQICQPHLTKWKERAKLYLEMYKRRPTLPRLEGQDLLTNKIRFIGTMREK